MLSLRGQRAGRVQPQAVLRLLAVARRLDVPVEPHYRRVDTGRLLQLRGVSAITDKSVQDSG